VNTNAIDLWKDHPLGNKIEAAEELHHNEANKCNKKSN
jgi:hypothetical protein